MEFEDLLSLAELNTRFQELISRHYAIHKFRIHEKQIQLYATTNYQKTDFEEHSISVYNSTLIVRFLKSFGHLISCIQITQSPNDQNAAIFISGLVNKYCSESLIEMTLHYGSNWNVFWHKPFKQLNKVLLQSLSLNCENNMKDLTEIFPSLKHLAFVFHVKPSALECFEKKLLHLKYVTLPMYTGNSNNDIHLYKKFIETNSHIRNVSITSGDNFELLRLMSEKLPNLEILKFNTYLSSYPIDPTNDNFIRFNRLKELEIGGPSTRRNRWSKFHSTTSRTSNFEH